ncbi:hypothetical protein L1049_002149 [Liquidambar formosana]|uniref:Vacuolar proton pump subunit H n=1 Tax=Liquidambar formosana TaxID=63359 RepID=A0AAP0R766_LIQFO
MQSKSMIWALDYLHPFRWLLHRIAQIALESARPKTQDGTFANGEASNSKKKITTIDDVLKGLVEWLCAQLKQPSHPSRGIPTAINCLATLLKEPVVRSSFVQADGVKLLIPLISPATTQQSMQLLYETCLCIWLLSYYEPAIEYLATSRILPRLIEVVKGSTKEKVVRVVVLIFRNLLHKGTFGAQMVDLGLPQIVQSLKAQAWSDEDLLEALNQLEEGLKDNIKKLSSFDKYKQEVLLGHLDWSPMHKDPQFWRENITHFEENDFQILRVLITILDTSNDPRALAVACFDLSQFIQYHPAGRIIVTDLKAKERVMKLMNHENAEVTKNALLCIQRLFLGAKYASFLQPWSIPPMPKTHQSPQDYIDAHNAARTEVGVGPMTWDDTVAAYAQSYANQHIGDCNLVHSNGPYGENLAMSSGDLTGTDAVKMWVDEKANYDYNSNSCTQGMCGHYTQVVWSNSVRLGCAKVQCSNGGTFISCNYDPRGNYVGERLTR